MQAVLKYTPEDHPDREPLDKVYSNIMDIVNMVNERTRQVENVQKLMRLQKTIANSDVRPHTAYISNFPRCVCSRVLVCAGAGQRFREQPALHCQRGHAH